MSASPAILLGSVAIEPARWAHLRPVAEGTEPPSLVRLSDWVAQSATAGFDGIEVWERHLVGADDAEVHALTNGVLPLPIFNSYVSLDDPDHKARESVARSAQRAGSSGIKFNVGNDPAMQAAYSERIAAWLDMLPPDTALLCECHHGISIAEDPQIAQAIFNDAGASDRVQTIVHTHETADHIRSRFDAYGDRITHVHVNFLDFKAMSAPRLVDVRGQLEEKVDLLATLGFTGSWTLEFVSGLLSDHDNPTHLMAQAAQDLLVLKDVLA